MSPGLLTFFYMKRIINYHHSQDTDVSTLYH